MWECGREVDRCCACGSRGWTSGRRDQIVLAIFAESALQSSALGCAARLGMMGLNGGPQDAGNLAGNLARVLVDGAPDSPLDLCNRQRRNKRLDAKHREARRQNFGDLAAIAADPARARQTRVAAMTPEAAE